MLFVKEIGQPAGCTSWASPSTGTATGATQQIRSLMTDLDSQLNRFRFFLCDRDGKFSDAFDTVLADAGIHVLLSPPRFPKVNAFGATPDRHRPPEASGTRPVSASS